MKRNVNLGWAALAGAALLLLPSCMFNLLEKEKDRDRVILKKEKQVPSDLAGYVAVPDVTPKEVVSPKTGLSYFVLGAYNLVPEKMKGYIAMSPGIFKTKLGVDKIEEPAGGKAEPWVLKYGKEVPADLDGWIGLKPAQPRIIMKGEEGTAELGADQIIPKEMHGWVAMDREVMAKWLSKEMFKGVTIPEKEKKAP